MLQVLERGIRGKRKERDATGSGKRDMRQKEGEGCYRFWEEGYDTKGRRGKLKILGRGI